jgi:hypothetical protein
MAVSALTAGDGGKRSPLGSETSGPPEVRSNAKIDAELPLHRVLDGAPAAELDPTCVGPVASDPLAWIIHDAPGIKSIARHLGLTLREAW